MTHKSQLHYNHSLAIQFVPRKKYDVPHFMHETITCQDMSNIVTPARVVMHFYSREGMIPSEVFLSGLHPSYMKIPIPH